MEGESGGEAPADTSDLLDVDDLVVMEGLLSDMADRSAASLASRISALDGSLTRLGRGT